MTTATRRLGMIGVGFGALVHVPSFQSEGWEVAAAWSRRSERAREQAAALGIPDVPEDWREIIERPDIDAIAIATPPPGHHEIALAAIRAGKHVLCEKPFTLSTAEAFELEAAAREAGVTAMLGHEFRFAPQRAYIKQLLDEGYIGTPELAHIELFMGRGPGPRPPAMAPGALAANGGGFLGGLGSHFVDGLRHWFGEVEAVTGTVRTLRPDRLDADGNLVQADADDTFSFRLEFESGVTAVMTGSSAVAPGTGGRITLSGTEGVLFAAQRGPNPEPDGVVLGAKNSERALAELPMPERYTALTDERDHRMAAFRLLVREFARGIEEGTSPAPSFTDGARSREVLDAVRESSATGRTVTLTHRPR